MTCWGILPGGGQMLLGDARELVLSYDRDAPADQLKAVFPAGGLWGPLSQVVAYEEGRAVFRGIVDEQNTRLDADGLWVELVCRSLEAVLLDNEACPDPIYDPSLGRLAVKLLEPLGFSRVEGDGRTVPGVLEIEKGVSCWKVLADFCGAYLGTVPYVDTDGVLHCEGGAAREAEVSQVMWAEVSRLPCRELSEVWQQSFRGTYDTPYREPGAIVRRRRYTASGSGTDPKRLLENAREQSWRATLECAGILWPARGQAVSVELPRLGRLSRCPVVSARCYTDGRGARTRLVLGRGQEDVAD